MPGRSYILFVQRKFFILFSVIFQIHFGRVYTWPMDHSFDQRTWFIVVFFSIKENYILFRIWIFFVKVALRVLQKLRSSKKAKTLQIRLILRVSKWKNIIFYYRRKKQRFFLVFTNEIIFYNAELFASAVNFKFPWTSLYF